MSILFGVAVTSLDTRSEENLKRTSRAQEVIEDKDVMSLSEEIIENLALISQARGNCLESTHFSNSHCVQSSTRRYKIYG